ncbi:metal-dependent hydrolase family protein [Sulfobacillus harzensis]|uniref:Amidohydrolase family protein n=1 Tax=Sulfobacillus harzensis TaxID=2729629 RepID=A0A7Y0L5U9_9FIRM|nr:amidohydrolase family protein [Sulfobacillus harzensis]NMP22464.1 amidohydrolase family protein [Sulfobacillus harzensis]
MSATYLYNGTLIDGTGHAPVPDAALYIEDNVIRAVGPQSAVLPPLGKECQRIDLHGGTILPGFIDCHVHLTFQSFGDQDPYFVPYTYHVLKTAQYASATLDAGITSVRDAGGADRGIQRAIDEGLIRGPRSQISVTMLSITGGHGDDYSPHLGRALENPLQVSGVCDGADGVRKKVREVIRAGAQVIKAATSGGVLSPTDNPEDAHFTLAELEALVDEARMHGNIKAMAHAQAAEGIKNAVRAGFHSIEHGIYLDNEAIDLMLEHGTYLVPTLVAPLAVIKAFEAGRRVPSYAVEKSKRVMDAHHESIARAYRAGVTIAMGTDSGVGAHGTNLEELYWLTQIGMRPMEAIVASTKTAAECLGWSDRLGTLEAEKLADLVVVRQNPLDNIKSLADRENIALVMKDGQLIVH